MVPPAASPSSSAVLELPQAAVVRRVKVRARAGTARRVLSFIARSFRVR
jgi:hypothetical protein